MFQHSVHWALSFTTVNSHLHFLMIVESATFQLILQQPKLHIILFCLKSEIVLPYLITCQEPNFYWGGIFKAIHQWNKWAYSQCHNEHSFNFYGLWNIIYGKALIQQTPVSNTLNISWNTQKFGIWSSHNGADKCNYSIYRKKISHYFWQENMLYCLGIANSSLSHFQHCISTTFCTYKGGTKLAYYTHYT